MVFLYDMLILLSCTCCTTGLGPQGVSRSFALGPWFSTFASEASWSKGYDDFSWDVFKETKIYFIFYCFEWCVSSSTISLPKRLRLALWPQAGDIAEAQRKAILLELRMGIWTFWFCFLGSEKHSIAHWFHWLVAFPFWGINHIQSIQLSQLTNAFEKAWNHRLDGKYFSSFSCVLEYIYIYGNDC